MYKKIKNSESGSLLLMSVLILTGLLSAASTIGLLTLKNIKQTILVDASAVAFYAAESGVEDSLYEIRKNDTAPSSLGDGSLGNSATFSRTISTNQESVASDISEDDIWSVNLYNPNDTLAPLDNPIKSLLLSWQSSGSAWLEVRVTPWDTSGNIGIPASYLLDPASSGILNLEDSTATIYRAQIRPLYEDVTNVVVKAYSAFDAASGTQVDLPSNITVYSEGAFSRSKQVVRSVMPARSPLSGAFSYVLFTEDDLIK